MKPKIEMIFTEQNEISIDAQNFKGIACEKATQYLEQALGKKLARTIKPERHQQSQRKQRQRIRS